MHAVIVGSGIAGMRAAWALRARRPDARITVISDEAGPPFSRPALMYIATGQLRASDTWLHPPAALRAARIDLRTGVVDAIDVAAHALSLDGDEIGWDRLLLAVGAEPRTLGCPGEDLDGVFPFTNQAELARLEAWLRHEPRRAAIVGGGLIGVELAEVLRVRGVDVELIVREPRYAANLLPKEESALVAAAMERHGVAVRFRSTVAAIEGKGSVEAVRLASGERLDCDGVGVTIGVRPRTALAAASGLPCGEGIRVDERLRALPDVFAAGDCAEIVGRRPEAVWFVARAQGEVAGRNLAGDDVAWVPGPWFNAAKFFDLEWQVYGDVPANAGPDDSFVWLDDRRPAAVRAAHDPSGRIRGISAIGVRLRRAACEALVARGATVGELVCHIDDVLFDAELSPRWAACLADAARQAGLL